MNILIINPNTTASMTDKIGEAARMVANHGTAIEARNPLVGPASIQGPEDGRAATPGLLAEVEAAGDEIDAIIIACFDDTALYEARRKTRAPVIGIGEAAYHAAMLISERFSVVTTLAVSIPVIEENIRRYGFSTRCARVRASNVPVLDLEVPGSQAQQTISTEISDALEQDGCDAIVLGCAGMADLAASLAAAHGVPVIDGIAAAVKLAEGLARMNLRTSQFGGFRLAT